MAKAAVELAGGWWDADGARHRRATLRALRGSDEERLHELAADTLLCEATTGLLARTVRRIGPARATPELLRALAPGDRGQLVLELWRRAFSDRMALVLTCPACGERMDVDVAIGELPLTPAEKSLHRVVADVGEIAFRLPVAADLEELAAAGELTADGLLRRCVVSAGDRTGSTAADSVARSPSARAAVEDAMERLAPGVGDELEAQCPECAHVFSAPFDPAATLVAEVTRRRSELDRDIHLLASTYHWPLGEILRLERRRRRAAVDRLLAQLDPGLVV
jgi:hypothetical protein